MHKSRSILGSAAFPLQRKSGAHRGGEGGRQFIKVVHQIVLVIIKTAPAGVAIEQLAGSSTANLTSATLGASAQVGSSMLAAMHQLGGGAGMLVGLDEKNTPVLAAIGVPAQARNLNDPNARGRLWLQGIGSYGKLDGDHRSNDLSQRTQGNFSSRFGLRLAHLSQLNNGISLLLEAGLDVGLSARHSLGLDYIGELGSNCRNHALTGQWQMRF